MKISLSRPEINLKEYKEVKTPMLIDRTLFASIYRTDGHGTLHIAI